MVGANVVRMDCEEHDLIFAAVSHLPHLVAYGMVNSLLTIEGLKRTFFPSLPEVLRISAVLPQAIRKCGRTLL